MQCMLILIIFALAIEILLNIHIISIEFEANALVYLPLEG